METVQVNSTMPDNNNITLVHASTESDHNQEIFFAVEKILFYISCVLTTAALVYGVTSWCLLQKFRNYRNYVFLNAILLNFLVFQWYFLFVPMFSFMGAIITVSLFLYLAAAKIFWLIVICHMFYVDIVKVFNGHMRRKYLKSALFGWGASLLTAIIEGLIEFYTGASLIVHLIFGLPLILNSLLYFVIIWSLFRSSNASAHTTSNKGRLFFIATLIFLLSDGFILCTFLTTYLKPNSRLIRFLASILNRLMTSVVLNVYLVVVKTNRELWYAYYVKKMNERKRNRDMQMNVQNVRQTANKPAVINAQN